MARVWTVLVLPVVLGKRCENLVAHRENVLRDSAYSRRRRGRHSFSLPGLLHCLGESVVNRVGFGERERRVVHAPKMES